MPGRTARRRALAWLLLLLLPCAMAGASARAADDAARSVSPAEWGVAAELLDERLQIPTPYPRALMYVRCFGLVGEDGTIAGVGCNPNRDERAYSEALGLAVSSAADGLRIQPASIDGDDVPLRRFPFSVMVAPRPDNPLARPLTKVVANHVLETRRYGVDYTAPQEVFTDVDAPRCRTSRALSFAYTVAISARGEPGTITVTDEDARALCEDDLRRYLDESVFVPASHEGRFVDALFLGSVTHDGDDS